MSRETKRLSGIVAMVQAKEPFYSGRFLQWEIDTLFLARKADRDFITNDTVCLKVSVVFGIEK